MKYIFILITSYSVMFAEDFLEMFLKGFELGFVKGLIVTAIVSGVYFYGRWDGEINIMNKDKS